MNPNSGQKQEADTNREQIDGRDQVEIEIELFLFSSGVRISA
jgi:hypothetical protein